MSEPTATQLLNVFSRVDSLRVHRTESLGKALKKPLLLLLLISRFEHGLVRENKFRYTDLENDLSELILDFGGRPTLHGPKPEQPFYHFDLWSVSTPGWVREGRKETAPRGVLRDPGSSAVLDSDTFEILRDATARSRVSSTVLDRFWPESLHQELRDHLGLPVACPPVGRSVRPGRDSSFVGAVLENYKHRCAMCGFQARFGAVPFGLDAAHVRWYTCAGPDEVANGLALCKLHHWALDRGVVTIETDLTVTISPMFAAHDSRSTDLFQALHGKPLIRAPVAPAVAHLDWHRRNVFRDEIV